jgi:hypothetical protein
LDGGQDGVQQITQVLADDTDVAAVHILSHGSSGSVTLGSTRLDADHLDTYAGELSLWGSVLTGDADILLYGCNVASDESGLRLIENLSLLTGADVAASEDATGPPSLGGDWELEHTSGAIEAASLLGRSGVCDYGFLLGPVTGMGTAAGDEITLETAAVTVGTAAPQQVNPDDDLTVNGLEGDDTFIFSAFPEVLSIAIDGGDGTDTLDLSAITADLTITLHADGSVSATDGTNSANNIRGMENLIGGSGAIRRFSDGALIAGTLDGGAGIDVVDYTDYTPLATANLAAGLATGTGGILSIENVLGEDDPLLFVHGFAGSLATEGQLGFWLSHRGLHPDLLDLEPLQNTYDDLIQSLVNVGYRLEAAGGLPQTLYVANWDWRVPVAPTDDTMDGTLSNVLVSSITDLTFETGLDYLGYWLKRASDDWFAQTGLRPDTVDIITHSTGGLLARSYVQSAAHAGQFD